MPEVLHRRARAAGQSLQEYLRSALIAQVRQSTLQEIFDEVERDPVSASAPLAHTTSLVRRDAPLYHHHAAPQRVMMSVA